MTAPTKATTETPRPLAAEPADPAADGPISVPAQSGVFTSEAPSANALRPGPLGPGLHAAYVEAYEPIPRPSPPSPHTAPPTLAFRVRTLADTRLSAILADGVEPALLEHCLRSNQLVMLSDSPRGVLILGALQIQQTLQRDPDGTLVIEARRIELRATEEFRAQSGSAALKLQAEGKVRVNGHRMLIDVDTNVRVLSALVELP
jgi:hypothetical protein